MSMFVGQVSDQRFSQKVGVRYWLHNGNNSMVIFEELHRSTLIQCLSSFNQRVQSSIQHGSTSHIDIIL